LDRVTFFINGKTIANFMHNYRVFMAGFQPTQHMLVQCYMLVQC